MECADEINQMKTVGGIESELGRGGDMVQLMLHVSVIALVWIRSRGGRKSNAR